MTKIDKMKKLNKTHKTHMSDITNKTNMTYMSHKTYTSNKTYMTYLSYFVLAILFLTIIPLTPKTASAATLTRPPNNLGLVGYWPMDEGVGAQAGDSSGQGNTGTITGASWVNGKRGGALSFNGSSNYVGVGASPSLNVSSAFTLSGWVKLNSYGVSGSTIISKRTGSNEQWAVRTTAVNNLSIQWYDGTWRTFSASIGSILSLGSYHYITITYDGSTILFYVDGVRYTGSGSTPSFQSYPSSSVCIGQDCVGTPNRFVDGIIDDVRIYNRALSASEVSVLYRSGQVTRKVVSNTGLVGYWSFNEGRGAQAGDSSGNGNTGTISGATWVDGKKGKALSFNGSSDYIHRDTFNNLPSSNMTLSAWVKTSSATKQLVVGQGRRPESTNGEYLYIIGADGKQLFWDYNGGYGYASTGTSNTSVSDGNWHYIVFVKIGTSGIYYLDGQADGTKIAAGDKSYITDDFVIGKDYRGNFNFFDGSIDDVRIYNRALSASEIQTLYKQNETKINSSQNNRLTNGLVGMWSFNGEDISGSTAYDRSGNGNNGTITGATPTIGKVGQGMSFDGVNDNVEVGENISLAPSLMSAFLWVKANNWDTAVATALLTKRTYPTNITGYFFFVLNTSKTVNIDVGDGVQARFNTNYTPPTGEWLYLGYTYDGNYIRFYVNGVLNATSSNFNKSYGDSGTNLYIGANQAGNAYFFNGSIDEVRIYNRALSASEVKQLYDMGK